MQIIVILIAISLSIAVLFLIFFLWNMRSGQYDDTYTPSVRILFENKTAKEPPNHQEAPKKEPVLNLNDKQQHLK